MGATNYRDSLVALMYDQTNQGRHQKELALYSSELAGCAGPVLEVACGTGMILLELLERGLDAYGFDISEEMLEVLYSKAGERGMDDIHSRVSRQDMCWFEYDLSFDAIIIPARSFLHLVEQKDQIACLRAIHAHLKPGGRLLMNFFNPSLDLIVKGTQPSPEYRQQGIYPHPDTGKPVELSFKQINDTDRQVQYIDWRIDDGEVLHETTMTVRWIYREEFKLLLRLAGFEKWELYGDFDRSAFNSDSDEMIWVAQK